MSIWYSNELTGIDSNPSVKANVSAGAGGQLRRYRATIPMTNPAIASGDTVHLCRLPAGSMFAFGLINASATMGASATLAIGVASNTGKYRAAATFTSGDTPTLFGLNANVAMDPYTAEEDIILTIAAAALPTTGKLVIDIFANAV